MLTLRPYQAEAKEAILDELLIERKRSTLTVMATGTGKTPVFCSVAGDYVDAGKKVLILAHRGELLNQCYETIPKFTDINHMLIHYEKAGNFATTASKVVLATVQTLKGERLERFHPDVFGLVIVDESHHIVAPNYRSVINHFANAKILGVTATPDRLDKQGLGDIFDSVAYVYDIIDGIRDGWLSPITSRMVVLHSFSLSGIKSIKDDLSKKDLENELIKKPTLWEIAKPTLELSGDRPTLIFGPTVRYAKQLANILNIARPGCADYLTGKDKEERRYEVVNNLRTGKIQFLVNCLLYTEGMDLPFVSCIVCARPTRSRALYSQMVGRGTRIFEGKKD
jgi:superfamily II DNA or RNA helicase